MGNVRPAKAKQDHVDRALDGFGTPLGDLPTVEFMSRLARIAAYCEKLLAEAYGPLGIKQGEVDVLNVLLLSPDEPQSPGTIGATLLCSSGAMTNRLDRLEKAGLVKRRHGKAQDRRTILIGITPEGRRVAKKASALREALTTKLIPGLSESERGDLVSLFRKMLVEFEKTEIRLS